MATKITKICDMSGVEIDSDTEPILLRVKNGSQSFDRKLELSEAEKAKLVKLLKPYVDKGSEVGPVIVPSAKGATNPETATIRAWGIANGHKVSEKGRVPQSVVDAYHAAEGHASEADINAAIAAGEKASK